MLDPAKRQQMIEKYGAPAGSPESQGMMGKVQAQAKEDPAAVLQRLQAKRQAKKEGTTSQTQEQPSDGSWMDANKNVGSFGMGTVKGAVKSALSLGELGSKALESGYNATIGRLTGKNAPSGGQLAEDIKQSDPLQSKGILEKIGEGAEQVGEFVAPIGIAGKAEKAVAASKLLQKAPKAVQAVTELGVKAGLEGAEQATRSALQSGKTDNLKSNFVLGAAMPLAGHVIKGAGSIAGETAKFMSSKLSGVPKEAIEYAISNPTAVKKAMTAMAKDGTVGPQQVVEKAESALQSLKEARRAAYKDSLKAIESDQKPLVESVDKVKDAAKKAFEDFKIGVNEADELVPTIKSTLPSGHVNDLKEVYDRVKKWDDFSATGLDDLREVVSSYERGGINPAKADKQFDKILGDIKRNVVDILPKNVRDMNKQYAVQSDFIDRIRQEMSLDKDKPVTAARKLMNMFSPRSESYKDLVSQLGHKTAKDIQSDVAALLMSKWTPEGLGAYLTAGLGGGSIPAALTNPLLLPGMAAGAALSSPKIVGKVATTIGKLKQSSSLKAGGELLDKAVKGAAALINR